MVHHYIRIIDHELGKTAGDALLLLAQQCIEADEATLLVPGDTEAEARFEWRILRRNIMAPMPIGFLDA